MPELKYIPLDQIRVNPVSLRPANKNSEEFEQLRNSIKADGIINAISVRNKPGEDGKQFELVDGLQRFTAASEVGTGVVDKTPDPNRPGSYISKGKYQDVTSPDGKTTTTVGVIPAQIIERDEADTIVSQIIGNAHRIQTKPIEYAKALFKYLAYNPTLTLSELAARLNKSPVWLEKQMGLLQIADSLKALVNEGKIPAANAYVLSKLPPDEQVQWSERAQTMPSSEFSAAGLARVKAIRDAHRKGQDAGEEQFVAVAHLRKKLEIEAEMTNPEIGPALVRDLNIVAGIKPSADGLLKAAQSGFQLALNWAMNMDPKSVQVAKQKDDDRRKKAADEKTRREAEKSQKKLEELKQKTAEAEAASKVAQAAAAAVPEPVPA